MGLIVIDHEKCNRDGICAAECPARVIESPQDGLPQPGADFEEICLRCGHCVAVCPTGAFSLDWMESGDCQSLDSGLDLNEPQANQFLLSRRSIRVFKDRPVEREKLEKLVWVGCQAPSAKNVQPWQWLVIQDQAEMDRLEELIADWMRDIIRREPKRAKALRMPRLVDLYEKGDLRLLRGAPHLMIALADRTWPFGAEDTALALGNVSLLAPVLGLGTCWSGYLMSAVNSFEPMADQLNLAQGLKVFGALMVGYPKLKYHRLPLRNEPIVEWR